MRHKEENIAEVHINIITKLLDKPSGSLQVSTLSRQVHQSEANCMGRRSMVPVSVSSYCAEL